MKKPLITALIAFFLIIAINTSPAHSRTSARVSGVVKSEDGKPIKGVKVILIFSEDGTKYELTTDKKGIWKKANIRPGKWTIGFLAEGYEPENINVQFSAIKKNKPIEITLTRIPESPFSKGDELYKLKKYDEALHEYQRVIAENPNLYQAYEKMGLCQYRLEDLDNAIESFKMMMDKEPQSKDTLTNLSAIYFEKGDLEEGMKYFRLLDEKTLSDPGIFYNIGILLFKENQIEMAIDFLTKCVGTDPGFVKGHYQLALAFLNKGDMEKAKESLQKVIELAPDSDMAASAKKMLETIK